MKKIYLVISDYGYDGMTIHAAFSSEDKARQSLRLFGSAADVEEWDVDPHLGVPDDMSLFSVSRVEADGSTGGCRRVSIDTVDMRTPEVATKMFSLPHERVRWSMRLFARDEEDAIQKAKIKAAEMVESGDWYS